MYQGKYENNDTASRSTPRRKPPVRKKRRPRTTKGTLIFYGVYLVLILVFFAAMGIVMGALKNWLVSYEAAQPKVKCQEVFDDLFRNPDWAELYALAGLEDTAFENQGTYAAYMEETVAGQELTYIETSAGLSGDKKYIVRAGTEKIATFTLTADNKDADIPDWKLGEVALFFALGMDCTVVTDSGNTVTVNGVPLDESYVIRTVSTTAEHYLPEGIHGYRVAELYVDGLLAVPEVVVTDKNGEPVALTYDAGTRTYTQDLTAATTIGDSEYDTLLTAAQTYCRYMIGADGSSALRKCFDSSTEIYATITTNTTWMQGYTSYDFGEETISDYYRYSDDLYSARVSLTLNVTRKDGTVKAYELNSTFFLEKQGNGWMVIEMTNVNVQEQVTMVRLTYMNGDTVVSSEMVDAGSNKLTLPTVTAPEGQTLSGWFIETVDEEGSKTMSLAFLPGEDGTVNLSDGTVLNPMTLYALFETERA